MQLFRSRLAQLPPARVALLIEFVCLRVTVTATISSSLSHALKYFSLMQRGKQLQPVDALKGNVFAAMPEAKQVGRVLALLAAFCRVLACK